ncbi:discoidin domain-containing protein [Lysinibacillus sphaericus]|uniref:discoidin domain-containing protein n=1 Tax=Lysinibacillus sphaericus TaxID=1421 RepID=UPI003F78B63A
MPSIKYNNKEFQFNNIYYVDSDKGLDSNNGSVISPLKTVNYAISKCATTGDAIFALAGTHDVTRIAGSYDSGGLWDDNKAISFFGEQGKTIFLCDGTKHDGRDTHCIMFSNAGTKAYQITFDFKVGKRSSNNYQSSICGGTGNAIKGEVINCLFIIDGTIPNFTYSNSGTTITKFTNCSFDVKANFVGSYSGQGFTIENCATNFSFYGEGTRKNSQNLVRFDSNYHITNHNETNQNIGVFSGEFSWYSSWNTSGILLKSNNKTYSLKSSNTIYETKMISNTSPSPFVISASSVYSTSYPAWKAFNGDKKSTSGNCWLTVSGQAIGWVQIDYGKTIDVTNVEICGIHTTDITMQPKDFQILASNDGINFREILSVKNETFQSLEIKEYKTKLVRARYFRFNISKNGGLAYTGIGNIEFSSNSIGVSELLNHRVLDFFNYGASSFNGLGFIASGKNYILQDTVSENSEGLWKTELNRKPLSIGFN